MAKKVIFMTKTWEKDFSKFLSGAFERKYQSCLYPFDEKVLLLNNGVPKEAFKKYKTIYKTIDVIDKQWEVLEFYNLTPEDFQGGFWYSIAELTAIYFAKDYDYLCWLQGDCLIEPAKDWVTPAIKVLEENPSISVVSPGSKVNTYGEIDQEFSDQAFFIRVKEFRQPIYSYDEPEQLNYPEHGGHSFEYKCGQYLKNTGQGRNVLYGFNLEHEVY